MITVTISKGATSYELTNYLNVNLIQKNSLEIRESEYSSGYTPTINSASFKMFFAGPPASLLLEDDVEVIIARDAVPLFTGYVRPLTGLDFSGMGRADTLSVECLGSMSRLTAEHKGETVDLGSSGSPVVCNAAAPSMSYVHLMLSRLGWTRGLEAPVIPMAVPIALLRDGDVLLDKLAHVLFCAGHYITELPDGRLVIRPFAVENPVPEEEFSVEKSNIIKSLSVSRKETEEKAVAVTYAKFNRIPEYAIYAEDVKHVVYSRYYVNPSDRKPWVWPYNLDSEGVPPYLYKTPTNADWTWKTRYGVVRKKLAADGSETTEDDILIPLPAPDVSGLKEGLWKYSSLRAELIFWDHLVSHTDLFGSYRFDGSITARIASDGSVSYWRTPDRSGNTVLLEADHPLNGAVTASWSALGLSVLVGPIPYINDDQRFIYLEGLTIYGALEYIHSNQDAIADSDAPRIVVGTGEGDKRLTQSAELCVQPADAERLAKALYAGLGAPSLKLKSADAIACGAIVRVPHASRGIDVTGRIVARKSSIDRRTFYNYEIEGLSPLIIESDYYPAILAGLGTDPGPGQTIAELIAARIRQAHADAGIVELGEQLSAEDDRLTNVEEGLQRVHDGDIADGALDRATLEAGFVDEHERSVSELWPEGVEAPSAVDVEREARLAEVAAERDRLDSLEPEIFPYGPNAPSSPDILAGDLLSIEALANILEREMATRDEGMIIAEQRILLIAQDTAGAIDRVGSLEVTIDEIEAIVAEFSGDHTRIAALEIQADEIEASVSDYDAEKAKIASLQLTVDSINSILAELNVGGEIINLSLIIQNADRIAQIVADGGYTDAQNVFHPTKAYTQVTQLSDRYELFLAGDDAEKGQAAWIATVDQISSFVTALEVTGEIIDALAPVEASVSAIAQRADAIELSVADVAGSIDQTALETRETLLAALDQLEAQASSSIVLTQNRIDLIVASQEDENISLWARILLEADRITSEVGRATGVEVDLSSRIVQEAGRITQEIEDRTRGIVDTRSYIDQTAMSILSSVELDMLALDGTLRQVASNEAAAAQAAAAAYADGIVTEEEQRAIADAQAKADAARAAAIEAAAADASAKATAAREAAENYALTKANLAEITAKAYADGIVSEEEQRAIADAQAKADAAEQAATMAAASYTDSQILQLGNAIIMRVEQTEIALDPQEDGSVAYKAAAAWAQLLLEPGTFATRIQASEDGIITNGSLIEQLKDLIAFRVDEALSESTAGIVIAGNRIDLAVAEQRSSTESLMAQLSIEADRISSEVLRATESESSLSSQIVQQAGQIAARVRASQFNPEDGTWSDVQAIMALTVTLPSVISLERHDAIRSLLDAADRPVFDAVYEQYLAPWSEDGGQTWESDVRYRISPAATSEDLAALRVAMAQVGALSSQFLVDADEVLVPGTIRGRHLEMESVSTEVFTAIQARIQALSAKRLRVDTNPAIGTDFEVYIDEDNGILCKIDGETIFSIDPITKKLVLRGEVYAEGGSFEGSIHAGPMEFNLAPPSSTTLQIAGYVADFILGLETSTGLTGGRYSCSGNYGEETLSAVEFSITRSTSTYEYKQKTGTTQESYQVYEMTDPGGVWYDEFGLPHFVPPTYAWVTYYRTVDTWVLWRRQPIRSSCTIKLYNTAGTAIENLAEWSEPSSTWINTGTTGTGTNDGTAAPTNPAAALSQGVSFSVSGTLSLVASARTFKFMGLPAGYDANYEAGIVYVDSSGFLKIKI